MNLILTSELARLAPWCMVKPGLGSLLRHMRGVLLVQAIVLASGLGAGSVQAASFDCRRAATKIERMVCATPNLSALDEELAAVYRGALAEMASAGERADSLKRDQLQWLRYTRDACRASECLRKAYEERITWLMHISEEAKQDRLIRAAPGTYAACQVPGLQLPPAFTVLAAGGYAGTPLDFQIDQSGHGATRIDVTVHHPQQPVVLILGAYEPTIWSVLHSRETRLAAVVVSGYHRQIIQGVSDVPSLNSTWDNRSKCEVIYYGTKDSLRTINTLARQLVAKDVDTVYPVTDGKVTVGSAPPTDAELVSTPLRPVTSAFDAAAPLAGRPAIDEAVRKGLLRKATAEDAAGWAELAPAPLPDKNLPPVAGEERPKPVLPYLQDTYVVLGPFKYPQGLSGGNSVNFIIPRGVPRPEGSSIHVTVWDYNTGRCSGIFCGVGSATVIDFGPSVPGGVRIR
jgi:uncharacterized protein